MEIRVIDYDAVVGFDLLIMELLIVKRMADGQPKCDVRNVELHGWLKIM